jgi:FkbM family methyltransferase
VAATSIIHRIRDGLTAVDRRLGTRLATGLKDGIQLALSAPATPVDRLRMLALGARFATGRFEGPATARLRVHDRPVTMHLPDFAAFLVLHEIFALDQYRREEGPDPTTILDLGANIGASAVFYRLLYPAARIICVEPDPAIVPVLTENTRSIGAEVIHAAVAGSAGEVLFFPSPQSWAGSIVRDGGEGEVRVPSVTLDDLMERYSPDLIKIDVEGAEYDVFEASTKATAARVVVGEIHTREHDVKTTRLLSTFAGYALDVEGYGELTLFRAVR